MRWVVDRALMSASLVVRPVSTYRIKSEIASASLFFYIAVEDS